MVKPCCFVTHPEPQISGPLYLKMGQEVPKTSNGPRGPFFLDFPQMVETECKNEGGSNFKKMYFCDVHFSLGEKQILETRCIKQHAFLVDPQGVSFDFSSTHTLMFLLPQKGVQTKKGARKLAPASKFRSPGSPKGAHSDRMARPKRRRAFRVLRGERSPRQARHPVLPDRPQSGRWSQSPGLRIISAAPFGKARRKWVPARTPTVHWGPARGRAVGGPINGEVTRLDALLKQDNRQVFRQTNADICKKAVDHEFIIVGGDSAEFYGWTAKTANIGTSIRQIPYTFFILMLEDKIQKPSDYIF